MGGNALKSGSIRLTKRPYEALVAHCKEVFKKVYPHGWIEDIKAYSSKENFGDLDLLVTADKYDPFLLANALDATEVVRNGSVTSIGVHMGPLAEGHEGRIFQVDLIYSPPAEFDYAKNYFSFNDLGNLIGRTAHAAGLSHGHDGLWFYFRDGDYKFREILLTLDYDEALKFLGYNPGRFHKGFETLEDIFWYVAGSQYFNRDIFLLENRNAQSRIRDRKRPTYTAFLKFCEEHSQLPAYVYPAEKRDWLPKIMESFPHFKAEYEKAQQDLEKLRKVKEKFNGELVAKLTGLRGKELGELMKHIRNSFESTQCLHDFVLSANPAELEAMVYQAHNEILKQD